METYYEFVHQDCITILSAVIVAESLKDASQFLCDGWIREAEDFEADEHAAVAMAVNGLLQKALHLEILPGGYRIRPGRQ